MRRTMVSADSSRPAADRPEDRAAADLGLARRAAEGDRAAFEEIYRRNANRVYGLCLRLTADVGEAEILAQDTFVKAWFALPGFAGRGSLAAWLGRMAANLWKDRFRARSRRRRLVEELRADGPGGEAPPLGGPGAEDRSGAVARLLTAMDLDRCIARLPEGARTVYVFHDVEGYTHREIAGMLDVATGTVKAQLHRARRLIRTMLDKDRERNHGPR
jgi:RNA polymerase sigma-70 factor (ECF subfamily)